MLRQVIRNRARRNRRGRSLFQFRFVSEFACGYVPGGPSPSVNIKLLRRRRFSVVRQAIRGNLGDLRERNHEDNPCIVHDPPTLAPKRHLISL